jgi:serine/threonine protein kinase
MDLSGHTLGNQFHVIRMLGEGGMGQVYLARQLDMDRDVVIKVMHPQLTASSADAVERFKREARAVAQLNHPHIVQVHVFGQADAGFLYLAMEYIEGRSLHDVLIEVPRMPEPRVLRIVDQICSALAEAHGHGLIHRDLKPDNVMLAERHGTSDYVKVLDFGIAKLVGPEDAKMTQTGMVFGTPKYMAPEQAAGLPVDARTDLYALGVMLYEMLTGAHPFQAETPLAFLVKHASEPVPSPLQRFPDLVLSPRAQALTMRCLEKEPARRFQSAADLQHELRRALYAHPAPVRGYPSPVPRTEPAPNQTSTAALPRLPPATTRTAPARSTSSSDSRSPPGRMHALTRNAALLALLVGGGAGLVWLRRADAERTPRMTGATDEGVPPALALDGGELPAMGTPIQGLPVPKEARLLSRTPQALTLTSALDRDAILRFYAHHGKAWGALTQHAQGLQFAGATTPVSFVSVSPMPGGFMISLMRTGHRVADEVIATTDDAFGVPLPPSAEEYMRTADTLILQVPGEPDPVFAFYRERFAADRELSLVQTPTPQGDYMLIGAENARRPFRFVSITVTPEGLRAGGPSTQITIQAAK